MGCWVTRPVLMIRQLRGRAPQLIDKLTADGAVPQDGRQLQ